MLDVFVSNDGRCRTDFYSFDNQKEFAIAEKTSLGILLSKFNEHGEILDQKYSRGNEFLPALKNYISHVGEISTRDSAYKHVEVNAKCVSCNDRNIKRELDLVPARLIGKVPVVPIYVCISCKKKYYSMSDRYLTTLVHANETFFEPEERKLKEKDEGAFVKELEEYIIRIFASKKITLIRVSK